MRRNFRAGYPETSDWKGSVTPPDPSRLGSGMLPRSMIRRMISSIHTLDSWGSRFVYPEYIGRCRAHFFAGWETQGRRLEPGDAIALRGKSVTFARRPPMPSGRWAALPPKLRPRKLIARAGGADKRYDVSSICERRPGRRYHIWENR